MPQTLINSIACELDQLRREYERNGRQLDESDIRAVLTVRLDPGLHKVLWDEPVFILRATDECAPKAITAWIEEAHKHNVSSAKRESAFQRLHLFQRWQNRKIPD